MRLDRLGNNWPLTAAGFGDIQVRIDPRSRAFIAQWAPGSGIEEHVASASIEAVRPAAAEARCCVPACCEEKA